MSHKQKSIIFDLGAVLVDWNPQAIAQRFSNNINQQQSIVNNLFNHPLWIEFDNGQITELELIKRSSQQLKISINDAANLIQQAKESLSAKQEIVTLLKMAKSNGLKTYCLSNLSHEWFTYLQHRHPFFKLFDGKVISAQEGIGKPNHAIYQRLIERYTIDVYNTLFIDDREENIQSAEHLGIKGILFEHNLNNLKQIKQFIVNC